MASVKQYNGSWRATVKRKGFKTLVSHHPTKREAEEWAREQETNLRRKVKGMSPSVDILAKYTIRNIVERYRDEKSQFKGGARGEVATLNAFLRRPNIADRSLASFMKPDAYKYRDERFRDKPNGHPISYRTIVREIAILRHIWETAKEEWGFPIDTNPWDKIKAPPGQKKMFRRKRRLREGELFCILHACQSSGELNGILVPFAIRLTIETGMRLQEVMNLKWKDVDIKNRRIEITKSKTDLHSEVEGRTIVMTLWARHYLECLQVEAREHDIRLYMRRYKVDHGTAAAKCNDPDRWLRSDGPVFPPTEDGHPRIEAFKRIWKDILQRAGIPGKHQAYTRNGKTIEPDGEGLTFHDLRHEAGSWFDSAGLTKGQHDLIMGHSNRDIASVYIHAELSEIQAKLDGYSIPQIEKTDWLPYDIKKVIIHGHPEEEDTPEQYFDTDGYTYIIDKNGNRQYLDKDEHSVELPPNVVQFNKRQAKGSK
jgi:integrase